MTHTVVELQPWEAGAIQNHLLRLSKTDRYTRFFAALSDDAVKAYVKKLFDNKHACFGIYHHNPFSVDNDALIAFADVAVGKDGSAEIGISINEEHRGVGHARKMMKQILSYCHANGVSRLYMSCLRENTKMQHLAKTLPNVRMILEHDEAIAELELDSTPSDKAIAVAQELYATPFTLLDKCYRFNKYVLGTLLGE
jgi:RimJ/RimL family protein N-acetyltransferase